VGWTTGSGSGRGAATDITTGLSKFREAGTATIVGWLIGSAVSTIRGGASVLGAAFAGPAKPTSSRVVETRARYFVLVFISPMVVDVARLPFSFL
jgi:hypothetical protein